MNSLIHIIVGFVQMFDSTAFDSVVKRRAIVELKYIGTPRDIPGHDQKLRASTTS